MRARAASAAVALGGATFAFEAALGRVVVGVAFGVECEAARGRVVVEVLYLGVGSAERF